MRKIDCLQNVTIEVLNYCNSSCIHCYLDHSEPKILDINDVISVIDQAETAGAMQITLTGGEPLLHPNIKDIIVYIKSKGMAINLLTSLNIDYGEWLNVVLLCDKIGISLYGSTGVEHDQVTRIDGSFDKMMKNLKYLIKNKSCVSLNMTIMKQNIAHVREMIAFAERLNLPYRINYILHGEHANNHQITFGDLMYMRELGKSENDADSREMNFMCVAGSSSLWIDVDLNVYPCVFFRMHLGNLLSQTLADIWINSEKIKSIKRTASSDFKKCQECELKKNCTPCMGENYNANGDVTIPCDFSCRIGEYGKCLL